MLGELHWETRGTDQPPLGIVQVEAKQEGLSICHSNKMSTRGVKLIYTPSFPHLILLLAPVAQLEYARAAFGCVRLSLGFNGKQSKMYLFLLLHSPDIYSCSHVVT